ncbi:DUF928 domain-containing protein [Kovacikia minuta CCNUW1]|uniref:DUF928 domain-containing protein n=1 Tax=Kovacikia minuta TaxID=2931930 RepID=UPI001CCD845C|nr:DUF928 domain-containing protein [Kovacikia minuta]UBF26665.1 DUF928 domain-containing protein [Kovacikia minuta CCNUW1]
MRLKHLFALFAPYLGLGLGLFVCSLPLLAVAVEFKPPRRGLPGRREGAGTRDPAACVRGNPSQLTAIMPQTNLGLTTAAYPRFFWYIPKTRAKLAEFRLVSGGEAASQDATAQTDKTPIYTATFSITGTPGIASLSIPRHATIPPLTVGQDYQWSLALVCNPDNRKQDIRVNGWVQRITPTADLTNKLVKASPNDRLRLYADNGIWFNTLSTLAELRCTNPQDASLVASWTELLKSVKLTTIAEQPLIQQCGEN